MKKFIITSALIVVTLYGLHVAHYRLGFYIDFHPDEQVTTFMRADEDIIYMERDGAYDPFEIRGVNLGVGYPGKWATDYAIEEETYLRWFQQIQEMGANTIRVYTILHDDFYNAFYEYNQNREAEGLEPLWLIHGVRVNDYVQNSHRDAFDDDFRKTFLDDCHTLTDILHGKKDLNLGYGTGSGSYRKDVSKWVIGYILGAEWEDVTVTYTNHKYPERNSYDGEYLYTTEEASPFEAMLCEVGDKMIEYESKRYKQQKLVAFSNTPSTDPFDYPELVTRHFMKCAKIDVEHIRSKDAFLSGCFASYHVYPFFPDYLNYVDAEFETDAQGSVNTYREYLKQLTAHHTVPVVISEYGVSTGRAMAQRDHNTGRNQGNMSEKDQGQAIIDCYEDIMAAGCAGSCVSSWQDEWFKRTWNTMHAVDLNNTPYWSDYQSSEQYFGLLAFDPGEEKSVCYVDGDLSEWGEEDLVSRNKNQSVSMKYDEKFVYFLIQNKGEDPEQDALYIPIDTNPKIGSTYCENYDVSFERGADFLIVIDGKENSRVMVQERNEVLRAMYGYETSRIDPYTKVVDPDTPVFKPIQLMIQSAAPILTGNWQATAETYETGLLTYGNANPESEDFNSLADFIFSGDCVELKLPWELLNFSNPSEMKIHDDYYQCYGVENLKIDEMFVGVAAQTDAAYRIPMDSLPLEGWGNEVTSHERLKPSYYMLKEYWGRTSPSAD